MLMHPPRVQNPEGEAAEGGAALAQGRKPSGVSGHLYQDTPNPMLNLHCRSRSANRSQLGVEPKKGSQQSHQKRLSKSLPHTQQEERKKTQHRRHRKKPQTHIQGPPEMVAYS